MTSDNTTIRRNTFDLTSASETLSIGENSTIEYNLFKSGGLLQIDGATCQVKKNEVVI